MRPKKASRVKIAADTAPQLRRALADFMPPNMRLSLRMHRLCSLVTRWGFLMMLALPWLCSGGCLWSGEVPPSSSPSSSSSQLLAGAWALRVGGVGLELGLGLAAGTGGCGALGLNGRTCREDCGDACTPWCSTSSSLLLLLLLPGFSKPDSSVSLLPLGFALRGAMPSVCLQGLLITSVMNKCLQFTFVIWFCCILCEGLDEQHERKPWDPK